MPIDQYLALSFGGSHVESDMIVFVTSSAYSSIVYDMYSTGFGEPVLDTAGQSDIEWSNDNDEYPLISFNAKREFDTGDA